MGRRVAVREMSSALTCVLTPPRVSERPCLPGALWVRGRRMNQVSGIRLPADRGVREEVDTPWRGMSPLDTV